MNCPNTYHNGSPENKYTVQYTYFDEWVGLIDEFVENIDKKRLPKINIGWHKNTIKAMNAVYESHRNRKGSKTLIYWEKNNDGFQNG